MTAREHSCCVPAQGVLIKDAAPPDVGEAPARVSMEPASVERPDCALQGPDRVPAVLIPAGPFRYGCDRREGPLADGEGPSRLGPC